MRRVVFLLIMLAAIDGLQSPLALRGARVLGISAKTGEANAAPSPQMMAPRARKPKRNEGPAGYRPEKPWTKAQGVALYAFVYALIAVLIQYRQVNPVGGLPGVE